VTVPSILVVEDDQPTHALFVALAHRCGCETFSAFDGLTALRKLRDDSLDGVILDLLLPTLSGFDVLRYLKQTSPLLLPKTIVVTAAAETVLHPCKELREVRALLRKPFDVVELEEELRLLLGGGQPGTVSSSLARAGDTMRLKID
jgi:CheY-like chemotaxis protein